MRAMVSKKLNMYAVRDLKSNLYDVPFFAHNDLFATRRFIIDCRGERAKDSIIGTFKEDFELNLIGEFDTESGEVKYFKKHLLRGSEVDKNA